MKTNPSLPKPILKNIGKKNPATSRDTPTLVSPTGSNPQESVNHYTSIHQVKLRPLPNRPEFHIGFCSYIAPSPISEVLKS